MSDEKEGHKEKNDQCQSLCPPPGYSLGGPLVPVNDKEDRMVLQTSVHSKDPSVRRGPPHKQLSIKLVKEMKSFSFTHMGIP